MKKYYEFTLVNDKGTFFDEIETTSFKKAKEYFSKKYCGDFKVLWKKKDRTHLSKKITLS